MTLFCFFGHNLITIIRGVMVMAYAIDRAGIIFCIFLFCLVWCKFFIKNILLAIFISSIICLAITVIVMFLLDKRRSKILLSKQEQQNVSKVANFLLYNNGNKIKQAFESKLQAKFIDANVFICNDVIYYLIIKVSITKEDILQILKENNGVNAFNLVGAEFSDEVAKFCESLLNISINLIDAKKLYLDMGFNVNFEVNQIRFKEQTRLGLKTIALLIFNKKNFKGYIIAGIVLLSTTLIIRQKLYYYICASILFVLAFCCKFLARFKKEKR